MVSWNRYTAGMPYVITEPCIDVKDGTCVDVCPVDCIESASGSRMYYIDPHRCIDCNACRHVCPVDAIYSNYELPEGQEQYEQINLEFFAGRGHGHGKA